MTKKEKATLISRKLCDLYSRKCISIDHGDACTFLVAVVLLLAVGCIRSSAPSTEGPAQVEKRLVRSDTIAAISKDTVFLLREHTAELYHAIYIEKGRNSTHYHWMIDFSWDEDSETAYREGMGYFLAKSKVKYRPKPIGLPRYWLPLYRHDSRFVLYAPSDRGNAGKRIINDSAFVFWYMDGPTPVPIQGVEHSTSNTIELDLMAISDHWLKSDKLIVHLLDTVPTMAVFEFANESSQRRYSLYTPVEMAPEFDMVVNYSHNKRVEYEFERIDYAQLLRGR